jgi:ABC-type dipeptide/oligopeptide/nickel transport system ATPase subunit
MFGGEEIVYEVRYLDNNFEASITFDKLAKAKKFAKEVKGEIVKKSLIVEGHIPQWNKYVELYNLSEEYVRTIKNYSEENLEQMSKAETLTEFLSEIPENYDFGDDEISAQLAAKEASWLIQLAAKDEELVTLLAAKNAEIAAKKAQLNDIIESWPMQYETRVGERGVQLSGGQCQRIGIARALYKNSDVIIFDEATSALDQTTEKSVMDSIEMLDKDITFLIVAHRLNTLEKCSEIFEIKNGKITNNYKK